MTTLLDRDEGAERVLGASQVEQRLPHHPKHRQRRADQKRASDYAQARSLLESGHWANALAVTERFAASDPPFLNLKGVCLLRMGKADRAVEVFRRLACVAGGAVLCTEKPLVYQTNFATALLRAGRIDGCLSVLSEIGREDHPTIQRLRSAIALWKAGLTFGQRIGWYIGSLADRSVPLDGEHGELEDEGLLSPQKVEPRT